MLSGLKWDWIFAGLAVIFGVSGILYQTPTFFIGAIYAFSLALRYGPELEGREGIPVFMLVCLLYVVQTTPVRQFTVSMIHTLHALIMFRTLLLELRQPSALWVIPLTAEFGINVFLVYASIQNLEIYPAAQVASHLPARLVGVVLGVQLWLKFKNSLKLKKRS